MWDYTFHLFAFVRQNNADSLVRSFTGHMLEDDEGLYYCHARWYDADIGRFLQADGVLDGFNRYAYCHNSPIRFADPSGHATPVYTGGVPTFVGGGGGKDSGSSGGEVSTSSTPTTTPTASGHDSNGGGKTTSTPGDGRQGSHGGRGKGSRPDPKGGRGGQSGEKGSKSSANEFFSTAGNVATYGQLAAEAGNLSKASKFFGKASTFLGIISLGVKAPDAFSSLEDGDAFGVIDYGVDTIIFGMSFFGLPGTVSSFVFGVTKEFFSYIGEQFDAIIPLEEERIKEYYLDRMYESYGYY